MTARIPNPAQFFPDVLPAIQGILAATRAGGVPASTLELVHLRISQVNGCAFCVDMGAKQARKNGETDERLDTVAVWREATVFTAPERAALELAEHATRIADRTDPVPDDVWGRAAEHYDEKALAALVLMIATTNFFNHANVPIKQVPGAW